MKVKKPVKRKITIALRYAILPVLFPVIFITGGIDTCFCTHTAEAVSDFVYGTIDNFVDFLFKEKMDA
jgi:hypothetical protein